MGRIRKIYIDENGEEFIPNFWLLLVVRLLAIVLAALTVIFLLPYFKSFFNISCL